MIHEIESSIYYGPLFYLMFVYLSLFNREEIDIDMECLFIIYLLINHLFIYYLSDFI